MHPNDSRSLIINLTESGKELIKTVENFAQPLKNNIEQLEINNQLELLDSIINTVHKLTKSGIIKVQRTCVTCNYYERNTNGYYCHLI